MDKNIIRNHLITRFISEGATPGIDVTKKAQKESDKINKAGVKAVEKDIATYDKDIKQKGGDAGKMPQNKFNYNDAKEKEYHDQMEILNGMEMVEYDRQPNKEFSDRAKEGIEGSTRMGNKGGAGMGNAEATWGASSDDFGKNLVKNIKASHKKREDAVKGLISFGDDIETVPKDYAPMSKFSALSEGDEQASKNIESGKPYGTEDEYEFNNKEVNKKADKKAEKKPEDNNDKTKIKESMKRLRFNKNGDKPFNGVGNALKMIPESYKTEDKVFEMTDGNETYKIRWEGTLTEGRAVVLTAANKTMVNEDMQKMKHLMGYKSESTLGLVKGEARITENAVFNDIYKKTKALLEGEEIEGQTAPKGEWEDITKKAPEATKDIEGSVSEDKGTNAPKPKEGEWEEIKKNAAPSATEEAGTKLAPKAKTNSDSFTDDMPQAKDAKKHVEGTASTDDGTDVPAPSEGMWEEIAIPYAADAKKHIEGSASTDKGTQAPAPAKGNWDDIKKVSSDATKDVTMGS